MDINASIIEDLNQRYSVKMFDAGRKISSKDLAVIKEVLRLTPSSINSQPWRFIILESDEAKQRLASTFGDKYKMYCKGL